ncbi:hypothetical protein [Phenylobacterium sp. J367]|uniref:hypothetical protein n=1 Tax=Phenylobacterium sp. J367 TaxID=2898435 RepID=UPI00215077AC|nr:hypothetical protein [Phenylobacterium sp. J367]MCR5878117.1 hypothetical protein [Phenylobacterium sp. J367]
MKTIVPFLAAVALATPAAAQIHKATEARAPSAVLAKAAPEARPLFAETAEGLVHVPSGFHCPSKPAQGVVLNSVAAGPFAGSPPEEAAYCEYSDQEGVVARIAFSRDEPGSPILDKDFCRDMPKRLDLSWGISGLPGTRSYSPPIQSTAVPTLKVRGEERPLWICGWTRAPFAQPVIVSNVAALRAANGWTIRAMHTPRPPPCCNSYKEPVPLSFYLMPILLAGDAADPAQP